MAFRSNLCNTTLFWKNKVADSEPSFYVHERILQEK
jgi:hypothetical protein